MMLFMEKTVAPASHLTAAKVCHSLFYCQLMHNPFPACLIKEPQGQLQLPLLFREISDNLPFSGKYSYIAQHLKKQKNKKTSLMCPKMKNSQIQMAGTKRGEKATENWRRDASKGPATATDALLLAKSS